jgi:hypothetical protein
MNEKRVSKLLDTLFSFNLVALLKNGYQNTKLMSGQLR